MELLHDGVIAALAAIGVTAVLWLLASALFRQPPVRDTWYIVSLSGDGAGLDVTLRTLAQSRRLPVVLVDWGRAGGCFSRGGQGPSVGFGGWGWWMAGCGSTAPRPRRWPCRTR